MNSFDLQINVEETLPAGYGADWDLYCAERDAADHAEFMEAMENDCAAYAEFLACEESEMCQCEDCGEFIAEGELRCSDCEYDYVDDYDGQPDEAQEWYDFDPDC